ncbi:PHD finger protein 20 isoform X2 [Microcaecilia unicolor]|uniref:PHD finger protein 20 isoform X2 n=1 Tax=Microcaecilia unicolor TaxID=1415580 RepID=A0A6P7YIY4_9AMPH|nr:PHD finger protein 20 isoform X2 [Microcaecilia unicolor]
MTKHPPNRRGISFEVGAQLEARDRLKKWYAAHIEEINYEEGKVLIHFKRWNHRHDEWFFWDSPYLRPLEKIQLRKEGLLEEEGPAEFRANEQVLACWSDCRFYPAKVISSNKDGTYTVKFFDGVVQNVKSIHVKAYPKDENDITKDKLKEKRKSSDLDTDKKREKFKEQRKLTETASDKDERAHSTQRRSKQSDKEKTLDVSEKNKTPEKVPSMDGKEDKENISENERESSVENQKVEKSENDITICQASQDNRKNRSRSHSSPPSDPASQTLQPITLELRRRKISIGTDVHSKRLRLEKPLNQETKTESHVPSESESNTCAGDSEREQIKPTSELSPDGSQDTLLSPTFSPETEAVKDAAPSVVEPEEAPLESPVQSMQPSPVEETQQSADVPESTELTKNEPSQEETVVNKITVTPVQPQEVPAVTVTNALKKLNKLKPEEPATDLDQNKFKCKYMDCSKFFRKAKLLFYHMKYFHGLDKTAEQEQKPVTRNIQTRGSLASEKTNRESPKRRRTTSESLYGSHHIVLRSSPDDDKTKKLQVKRRNSVPSSVNMLNTHRPLLREKSKENQMDRYHRKQTDREKHGENAVQEKEKNKEKKYKNFLKLKLKKKKRKKSKSEYCGSEENIDISWELSSKLLKSNIVRGSPCSPKSMPLHSSDTGFHKDKPKIKEEDTLSNFSTDSALWSDEELDATMNHPDNGPDGEGSSFEIVRCMCEIQEENDFMIQCEECLCWQHGVCMGLLEENVPEKYICYICRNPPGQRASLKYWYDKEWLRHGCMHGLAFLEDNYSHQNAKKIVTTHQLLGDVQRVIEVLHGLQLKMKILQCKEHPDLKLWCQPWKHLTGDEKTHVKHNLPVQEKCCREEVASYRTFNGGLAKPSVVASLEESYITSEHCYQKPRAYYPAVEQRLVVETRTAAVTDRVNRIRENRDEAMERFCWELDRDVSWIECEPKQKYCKVRECVKKAPSENALEMKLLECSDGILKSQLNLLTHVEFLQDEVTHRMDFIEKELDVLESFLDYTGELEPPEPLARLPQLKRRIRQLLMDLGKVQQLTLHCSTYEHCHV